MRYFAVLAVFLCSTLARAAVFAGHADNVRDVDELRFRLTAAGNFSAGLSVRPDVAARPPLIIVGLFADDASGRFITAAGPNESLYVAGLAAGDYRLTVQGFESFPAGVATFNAAGYVLDLGTAPAVVTSLAGLVVVPEPAGVAAALALSTWTLGRRRRPEPGRTGREFQSII